MRKITLILIMLLAGFAHQAEASKKNAVKNVSISGQVFVVTKGRENIKLALVDVAAIPEKELLQYLKNQHARGLEQQKNLIPEVESAKGEAEAAETAEKLAKDKYNTLHNSKDFYTKISESMDAHSDMTWATRIRHTKDSNYGRIKDKFDYYFDSAKYYFENLPAQVALSKTDADGKFTLSLPPGKYAVAAKSSRDVFGNTENYYWLVWVDTSSPNHSVMLTNDNFFATKCDECVKPPMTPL